jgi:hypothetical protein
MLYSKYLRFRVQTYVYNEISHVQKRLSYNGYIVTAAVSWLSYKLGIISEYASKGCPVMAVLLAL